MVAARQSPPLAVASAANDIARRPLVAVSHTTISRPFFSASGLVLHRTRQLKGEAPLEERR